MQIAESQRSFGFMLLAPADAKIPGTFANARRDPERHASSLSDMQKMRGRVALREGAIQGSDLDRSGRFRMPKDESSWHLVRLASDGNVNGCARILVHPNTATFSALRLSSSAAALHPIWGKQVRWSVETDLAIARERQMTVMEPGGWVLEEKLRGTSEGVLIALSALALSLTMGNCLAYLTATVKHGSASMLRRLGAQSLYFGGKEIPSYFDPRYQCNMELLQIQTRAINARFESKLKTLREMLSSAIVLQAGSTTRKTVVAMPLRSEHAVGAPVR